MFMLILYHTTKHLLDTTTLVVHHPNSIKINNLMSIHWNLGKGKGKVHLCTGTEALYRPYGPYRE
jgi:hypothetical protein